MDILNSSLTPVRFLDIQRVQSPIKHDANLATCKARLESLVQTLQSNYAKWQLAQQRGTTLCYAIEAKKTRCLESENGAESLYPNDLKQPCDKLAVITSIFVDICKSTREVCRQMCAINKLAGTATNVIFYRTWKLQQFVDFTEELLQRYEKESVVKQRVMENIAHCTQRSNLICYTTSWEYPVEVDAYVHFLFLLLAEEVKTK